MRLSDIPQVWDDQKTNWFTKHHKTSLWSLKEIQSLMNLLWPPKDIGSFADLIFFSYHLVIWRSYLSMAHDDNHDDLAMKFVVIWPMFATLDYQFGLNVFDFCGSSGVGCGRREQTREAVPLALRRNGVAFQDDMCWQGETHKKSAGDVTRKAGCGWTGHFGCCVSACFKKGVWFWTVRPTRWDS